jgi:hypothetical protein
LIRYEFLNDEPDDGCLTAIIRFIIQKFISYQNFYITASPYYLIYVEILIRYEFLNDEPDDGCLTAGTSRYVCFIYNKGIYTTC